MLLLTLAKQRLHSPISLLLPCFFSSSILDPQIPSFMVKDYLLSTFGFSPNKVATISKPIANLKSPENPDAVHRFLQHQGFSESEIKAIVARRPTILCSSPENILGPNLRALRGMGLSDSTLTQIILYSPVVLQLSSAVSRINFWRHFVGGEEAALVKAIKCNMGLISHDIDGGIATKISLLQSHGFSTHDIGRIVCTVPFFIMCRVSTMEATLKRAKDLGIQTKSRMFALCLRAMSSLSKEAFQKKMEIFKSFGWSEEEFISVLLKAPNMVCLSEENLKAKVDFFLGETKCELSYITSRPWLLTHSLEKKLRPRHRVLRLLESKDLAGRRKDFYSAISLTDSKFVAKYILPYKEDIPELHKAYVAACTPRAG